MGNSDPLEAIAAPRPNVPGDVAARVLIAEFGLDGTLESLRGERDQNFRVTTGEGRRFVFKIANASEAAKTTDFQIRALMHVEQQNCPVTVPVVRRTVDGRVSCVLDTGSAQHVCRVVSFIEGTPLSAARKSRRLAADLGRSAAALDLALAGFSHAGDTPVLLWDLQRASALRELLQYLPGTDLAAAIASCLDDFDARVIPALPTLRRQVIHGDLNADNVLACSDNQDAIAGIIDLGDMLRAPLAMEVAIAAAYLRDAEGDGLALVTPFVAAFNTIIALEDRELELMFDLVRARLAATITITHWRVATRGKDDAYARHCIASEADAGNFLMRLNACGRDNFSATLRTACRA